MGADDRGADVSCEVPSRGAERCGGMGGHGGPRLPSELFAEAESLVLVGRAGVDAVEAFGDGEHAFIHESAALTPNPSPDSAALAGEGSIDPELPVAAALMLSSPGGGSQRCGLAPE